MLLTIDIGNTNLTLGLYQGQELGPRWRLATDHERMPDEYGLQLLGLLQHAGRTPADLTGISLSSVVTPLTSRLTQACQVYLNRDPFVVTSQVNSGIRILYDDPTAVGPDRIADAAAVMKLYGGPAVIIDFGTATTFNALTAGGDYLGGAIAPGIGIASDALYQRTSKLPRVDLKPPPSPIGSNTIHAIQSGLLYGYVSLVEGMVARFRGELGSQARVIATGGLAEIVAHETNTIQVVAPWLTLEGLRILWELNREDHDNPHPE